MSFYIVQEDGTSKLVLEDGSGSLILELGGTTFNQTLTAQVAMQGAITTQTGKTLLATVPMAATIIRQIGKTLLALVPLWGPREMSARDFVAANSDKMHAAASPLSGRPITITALVNVTSVAANRAIVSLNTGSTAQIFELAVQSGTGKAVAKVVAGAANTAALSAAGIGTGVWVHLTAVFLDATHHTIYVKGANKVTSNTSVSPAAPTQTDIGNNVSTEFFDGSICDVAIYAAAFSDTDALNAATGGPGGVPLDARDPLLPASSLVYYLKTGSTPEVDLIGAIAMTLTGTTVVAGPLVGGYGGLVKQTITTKAASSALVGTLVRSVGVPLLATVAMVGLLTRQTGKVLLATSAMVGLLTASKAFLTTLLALVPMVGTLATAKRTLLTLLAQVGVLAQTIGTVFTPGVKAQYGVTHAPGMTTHQGVTHTKAQGVSGQHDGGNVGGPVDIPQDAP